MSDKKVSGAQEAGSEIPIEVLAASIVAISDGIKKLRAGRLNDKALLLLIQHAAPTVNLKMVSQKEVRAVMEGIESLARAYLKKTP